ncbi:MAG: DUF2793 domain-containing protein [Sphingomonas sp.]|nr:DUF2793 domain-containing protein [Sphingomonas sp.]
MSDERSPRLALPLLQPGQAQKEADHNEALALLDIAVQPVVEAVAVDVPPAAPAAGQCWIVGAAPSGEWAGRAAMFAGWTASGWRYVAPVEGMVAWSLADRVAVRFEAGAWRIGEMRATRLLVGGEPVIGARRAAIADPAGGTTVDGAARATLREVLAALRGHGLIA